MSEADKLTIICRCEDITLHTIKEHIAAGKTTLEEIKRACRCSMGPCQGRTCIPLVAQEISKLTGKSVHEIALPTFRPPTTPIRLGTIAGGEKND